MDKRLLHFQNNGRERDIFSINEDRKYLQKLAASSKGHYHPKIQEYIDKAKPMENLIQALITALGAYPFWQQNVNGDRFNVPALSNVGDNYGYKTFLTGNYFTHHVNKDPALAKGEVLESVWNEKMNRVELIIGIDPNKDPDGATALADGESLAFSMGAKLPYDVCSICGNKAKTRAEYCDHLKYQMNQIDPVTGMLVGALNPFPKFFDISRVLIPADKTAYMWEKIASASNPISKLGSAMIAQIPASKYADMEYLSEKVAHIEEEARRRGIPLIGKSATVHKAAEIKKTIPATTEMVIPEKLKARLNIAKLALDNQAPSIDMKALAALKYSLPEIISTMLMMGMTPKASESHALAELFSGDAGEKSSYGPSSFSPELAKILMPNLADRSFARPVLVRRIIILSQKDPEEIKKMAAEEKKDGGMNAGIAAGMLAALAAMFHPTIGPNVKSFGRLIADHPFLAMAIGASVIRGLRELRPEKPVVSGEISLADPTRGFYNNDWQRRFVNAQSHPVTVIKTGADDTIEPQLKLAFAGLPALFMVGDLPQQPAYDLIEKNPLVFNNVLMKEARDAILPLVSEMIGSASRIVKTASLSDPEFLEMVPDRLKNDVWDLAIAAAAGKITR